MDRFPHAGMKAGPAQAPAGSMSQGFVPGDLPGDLRRDTDNSAAGRVARLAWFELAAAATRRSLAQDQAATLGLPETDLIDLGANPPRSASR